SRLLRRRSKPKEAGAAQAAQSTNASITASAGSSVLNSVRKADQRKVLYNGGVLPRPVYLTERDGMRPEGKFCVGTVKRLSIQNRHEWSPIPYRVFTVHCAAKTAWQR